MEERQLKRKRKHKKGSWQGRNAKPVELEQGLLGNQKSSGPVCEDGVCVFMCAFMFAVLLLAQIKPHQTQNKAQNRYVHRQVCKSQCTCHDQKVETYCLLSVRITYLQMAAGSCRPF